MIHIENNICPICYTDNLKWNLDINKSQMHMFKCGHGCCKNCYPKLIEKTAFQCPICRMNGQKHYINMENNNEWKTFAEWYNEWEIFIINGYAKNIIKNSNFGKQLIRLKLESKSIK
tara:strand:- start:77 stop:427 length:351 start_codon:yes stop_codon:yes gene_type:complete